MSKSSTPTLAAVADGSAKPVRFRPILLWGGLVVLLLALAGGGGAYYLARRNADPSYRAEVLTAKGDLRGAQVELRTALRDKPRDADLHLRLGSLEMDLADPVAAEKEFRLALGLRADPDVVQPKLADSLLSQGQNEEVLRQIVERPAGKTPEAIAQKLYRRAIAQLGLNDAKSATATAAVVKRTAPDSLVVPLLSARLAAIAGDLATTEAQVDAVLARDPAQIDALLMKQQMVTARGDHAAALDLAGRAVASAPWSAMARIRHATELLYANQDDKAKVDVDSVLSVQPRFIEAVYLNGILLARQGKYQDAAIQLAKLDNVLQQFPQALYYKALVAANMNQAETAAAYARRYNALVPGDGDGVKLLARSDIAVGAPEHAVPVLQKAIAAGFKDPQAYDLLGVALGNQGDMQGALAAFEAALALAPNDAGIMTHLGLAQIRTGKSAEAGGTLAHTLEISPEEPSAGEALVSAAIGEGDLPKAERALAALRARTGETQQTGILSGFIEVKRRNLEAAQAAFTGVLQRYPDSLQAKLALGRVLVQRGRRLDGISLMGEVLAKNPADIPTLNALLPLLVQDRQLDRLVGLLKAAHAKEPRQALFTATLADALLLAGDAKQAVDVLQAVRAAGPLPPLLVAVMARSQAAAGMVDDAKANYREVLRAHPEDLVDRLDMIALLLRTNDLDQARAELQAGLAQWPKNMRLLSTSIELEARVKGLDAGLKLAAELRADPSHLPFSTLLKGDALMRAGRFNAAARAYLDEYALAKEVPPLVRAIAALTASGQDDEATRLLREYLAASPNTPAVLESLAKLDIKANRLKDAQDHLEALLGFLPNDGPALNNLAWVYQTTGDGRARATAQKAYLQGAGADSADTLGWILVQGGDVAAGLPLLQQAAAVLTKEPSVQYHLAAALSASGRVSEALPLLQGLLKDPVAFAERGAAEKLLASLRKP